MNTNYHDIRCLCLFRFDFIQILNFISQIKSPFNQRERQNEEEEEEERKSHEIWHKSFRHEQTLDGSPISTSWRLSIGGIQALSCCLNLTNVKVIYMWSCCLHLSSHKPSWLLSFSLAVAVVVVVVIFAAPPSESVVIRCFFLLIRVKLLFLCFDFL